MFLKLFLGGLMIRAEVGVGREDGTCREMTHTAKGCGGFFK